MKIHYTDICVFVCVGMLQIGMLRCIFLYSEGVSKVLICVDMWQINRKPKREDACEEFRKEQRGASTLKVLINIKVGKKFERVEGQRKREERYRPYIAA